MPWYSLSYLIVLHNTHCLSLLFLFSYQKFYSSSHVGLAYHEHSNMNLVPLVEPFLLKLSMEKQLKSSPSPAPPLLLSSHAQSTTMTSPALPPSLAHKPVTSWTVNLQSQPIEVNISVDAVSHITKSIWEFQQSDPSNNPELYFRYSFENMTNEGNLESKNKTNRRATYLYSPIDLFFGQAGTDEGIFLPSKQSVLYSWRSKANQVSFFFYLSSSLFLFFFFLFFFILLM